MNTKGKKKNPNILIGLGWENNLDILPFEVICTHFYICITSLSDTKILFTRKNNCVIFSNNINELLLSLRISIYVLNTLIQKDK